MVLALPPISNSSSLFIKPLDLVLRAPVTIGIIVAFINPEREEHQISNQENIRNKENSQLKTSHNF